MSENPRAIAASLFAHFYAERHETFRNSLGLAADSAARITADEVLRGSALAPAYAQAYRLLSDRAMRLARLHAQRIDRVLELIDALRDKETS